MIGCAEVRSTSILLTRLLSLTTYRFTCRMGRAKAKPIIIDALRTSAHPMYKTDRW